MSKNITTNKRELYVYYEYVFWGQLNSKKKKNSMSSCPETTTLIDKNGNKTSRTVNKYIAIENSGDCHQPDILKNQWSCNGPCWNWGKSTKGLKQDNLPFGQWCPGWTDDGMYDLADYGDVPCRNLTENDICPGSDCIKKRGIEGPDKCTWFPDKDDPDDSRKGNYLCKYYTSEPPRINPDNPDSARFEKTQYSSGGVHYNRYKNPFYNPQEDLQQMDDGGWKHKECIKQKKTDSDTVFNAHGGYKKCTDVQKYGSTPTCMSAHKQDDGKYHKTTNSDDVCCNSKKLIKVENITYDTSQASKTPALSETQQASLFVTNVSENYQSIWSSGAELQVASSVTFSTDDTIGISEDFTIEAELPEFGSLSSSTTVQNSFSFGKETKTQTTQKVNIPSQKASVPPTSNMYAFFDVTTNSYTVPFTADASYSNECNGEISTEQMKGTVTISGVADLNQDTAKATIGPAVYQACWEQPFYGSKDQNFVRSKRAQAALENGRHYDFCRCVKKKGADAPQTEPALNSKPDASGNFTKYDCTLEDNAVLMGEESIDSNPQCWEGFESLDKETSSNYCEVNSDGTINACCVRATKYGKTKNSTKPYPMICPDLSGTIHKDCESYKKQVST